MQAVRRDLAQDNEAQSFVIRVRIDAGRRESGEVAAHLRIEHVNRRQVWQFTDVGPALAQLKTCLDEIVVGGSAA